MALDDGLLVRRILRVNHAGEHAAVSIYGAQVACARRLVPELVPWLEETRRHEVGHRRRFREAMPPRGARPCHATFLWAWMGALLGAMTSLGGRFGVMVCTAAVERTVHRHLDEQIDYLDGRDDAVALLIRDIQVEEDEHLAYAEARHDPGHWAARATSAWIAASTEVLIWLSTRGDSTRLHRELARLRKDEKATTTAARRWHDPAVSAMRSAGRDTGPRSSAG